MSTKENELKNLSLGAIFKEKNLFKLKYFNKIIFWFRAPLNLVIYFYIFIKFVIYFLQLSAQAKLILDYTHY